MCVYVHSVVSALRLKHEQTDRQVTEQKSEFYKIKTKQKSRRRKQELKNCENTKMEWKYRPEKLWNSDRNPTQDKETEENKELKTQVWLTGRTGEHRQNGDGTSK